MTIYFYYQNQSTDVSDQQFRVMLAALKADAEDFSADWNLRTPVVTADKPSCLTSADLLYTETLKKTASDPSAVAWHTEDESGNVFAEADTDQVLSYGGGVTDGGTSGESVLQSLGHEMEETLADAHVNLYADRFDGKQVAYEPADPVQGDQLFREVSVDGTSWKVLCTSYVMQAWFDPQCRKGTRLDKLGSCTAPFQLAKGGYNVVATSTDDAHAVFGKYAVDNALKEGVERFKLRHSGPKKIAYLEFDEAVPTWKRKRLERQRRNSRRIQKFNGHHLVGRSLFVTLPRESA